MLDFKAWLVQHTNTIFRYWFRARTPILGDIESETVNVKAYFGRIVDAVELPDGDVLLAFDDAGETCGYFEYHRLSEINLAIADIDQEAND